MSGLSFVVFIIAAGILMSMPGLIGPVFVMGGAAFFGLLAFHYVVWGRWISRALENPDENDPKLH